MMTRNTPSEISLLPEKSAEITTVQSTMDVSRRRRKTFALEGCGTGETGACDIRWKTTRLSFHCQFSFAERATDDALSDFFAMRLQRLDCFSFNNRSARLRTVSSTSLVARRTAPANDWNSPAGTTR